MWVSLPPKVKTRFESKKRGLCDAMAFFALPSCPEIEVAKSKRGVASNGNISFCWLQKTEKFLTGHLWQCFLTTLSLIRWKGTVNIHTCNLCSIGTLNLTLAKFEGTLYEGPYKTTHLLACAGQTWVICVVIFHFVLSNTHNNQEIHLQFNISSHFVGRFENALCTHSDIVACHFSLWPRW